MEFNGCRATTMTDEPIIEQEIVKKVEVQFTVEDYNYPYQDTLVFTDAEYKKMTPAKILKMQTDKYNDWKANILGVE
jgi:hypothetical protein